MGKYYPTSNNTILFQRLALEKRRNMSKRKPVFDILSSI